MIRSSPLISALYILILIFFSTPVKSLQNEEVRWKKINGISIPIPPAEHPRLYLRKPGASDIAMRLKHPVLRPVVDSLRSQSELSLQLKIEWDAIQYLTSKDQMLGRAIVDSALVMLKRTELPEIGDAARVTGRMMTTGAIVYDWLYDILTTKEKDAFITELIRLARTLECGYPPTEQGSVTGHSSESFIMRDMLSAGIAIYDEYPEMYEHAANRFFSEFLPVRNWIYNGRAYHQGDSYGPLRYSWDTYPLMIFSGMGVKNIYNPEQQYVPYYYMYATRPDSQRMRGGDTFLHQGHGALPGEPWDQYAGTLFTASYYKDGLLLDHYLRQGISDGQAHGRTNQREYIFQFLWWDVNLQPKPVSTLPLSFYCNSPFGWMIARTGWDSNAAIAEMKINEYNFSNHQHLDAGSFQIWYNAPLATESGLYGGTSGSYGSPHCKNYFWRTIAHNSLLIYDPDEKFSPKEDFGNDGGQRLPNNRWEPRNLEAMLDPVKGYKTGEILGHGFGPDSQVPEFTYLKGDLTMAYSSKVKEVKRSFVFLNLLNSKIPAALIVFDKIVSASPSFKKYWLLHSIGKPEINGNETIITESRGGKTGKLINTSLLPDTDDQKITPVGGPGKEFWVFGKNYDNESRDKSGNSTYERAAWRTEVSPERSSSENYFLNVMQIMDGKAEKLAVKKIDGENITGALLADRIVFFSKNSEKLSSSVSFTLHDKGNFGILVTDLAEGKWQVKKDNKVILKDVVVKAEDGLLYFKGTAGSYKCTQNLYVTLN